MDTFWKWLVHGSGSKPGYFNIANRWIFAHLLIAVILTLSLSSNGFVFAGISLFPAASILVGMSLAWTTRASALLQIEELRNNLFSVDRPPEDYVYGYQLAILVIVIMVAYTAVMAGGGFKFIVFGVPYDQKLSTFFMFFLMSLAFRECWGVVNFTNLLTLLEYRRS